MGRAGYHRAADLPGRGAKRVLSYRARLQGAPRTVCGLLEHEAAGFLTKAANKRGVASPAPLICRKVLRLTGKVMASALGRGNSQQTFTSSSRPERLQKVAAAAQPQNGAGLQADIRWV